jgi:hypothetical protein
MLRAAGPLPPATFPGLLQRKAVRSRHLAATALTLYGTVGIGAATTLLTLALGPLYAQFGAHGFWVMAALCAAALPLARTLREPAGKPT